MTYESFVCCEGDTNDDGAIDIDDIVNVVLCFGTDGVDCPDVGDNSSKGELIPHNIPSTSVHGIKVCLCFMQTPPEGPAPH